MGGALETFEMVPLYSTSPLATFYKFYYPQGEYLLQILLLLRLSVNTIGPHM